MLRREYFSVSSLPPLVFRLSHSLSPDTDANETTAGLRDIYVRFSRTLLLARRAFVDDDRIDVRLSFLLSLAPAPRSLFCSHARTEGALLLAFLLFLLLSLSRTRRWPQLYTCARDRVNTRRESETAEPLRDCLLSCRMYAHTLSLFSPVCVRTYMDTFLVVSQCVFNRLHISRGEKIACGLTYRRLPDKTDIKLVSVRLEREHSPLEVALRLQIFDRGLSRILHLIPQHPVDARARFCTHASVCVPRALLGRAHASARW